jgi:hypothetical protein
LYYVLKWWKFYFWFAFKASLDYICEKASVALLRCLFVTEIMYILRDTLGLPPQVKLKSHHMTYTVLVPVKANQN